MRIIFFGTPEFAVPSLQKLASHAEHFEIVSVVTQPDRPAGRNMRLQACAVKSFALEHLKMKDEQILSPVSARDPEFLQKLRDLQPDAAVVVAYGQILTQKLLDIFPKGVVNLHASLLPRWRGAAPIQRAVMAGDTESGVTLQKVVLKLDAGPIIGYRRLDLLDGVDAALLHDQLKILGTDLWCREFLDYLRGELQPIEQDELAVTYASKLMKEEARLDWSRPAKEIVQRVRGLTMGPIAWSMWGERTLKIHKANILHLDGKILRDLAHNHNAHAHAHAHAHDNDNTHDNEVGREKSSHNCGAAGTVVPCFLEQNRLVVICGGGENAGAGFRASAESTQDLVEALELVVVQPESRAKMRVSEYLRGYFNKNAGSPLEPGRGVCLEAFR